ncbi:MAG: PAS domain S-box protein [Spirochaetota bacterium]
MPRTGCFALPCRFKGHCGCDPDAQKALRVSFTYLAFGVAWILLSDALAHALLPGSDETRQLQTVKGLTFVLLSATLIYLLAWRELKLEQRYRLRLLSAESQLHQVAERTSDLMYTYQILPERKFTYVSPSCLAITGYSQAEHYRDPDLSYKLVHPDDRPLLDNLLSPELEGRPITLRWRKKDGTIVYIEQSIVGLRNEQGQVVGLSGIGRDVTTAELARQELEHLNSAYTVLWQVNRLIVRSRSVEEIYQEACDISLSTGNFSLAWIGVVDRQGNRVVPAFKAGEKTEYIENILITLDDAPTGRGPTGLAARSGKTYSSSDIATDPFMKPWRERALAHGFRSSAAFPLTVGGEVVAVWTLYSSTQGYFSERVRKLYDELAQDISFALSVRHAEAEKQRLASELETINRRWQFATESTGYGLWDWNVSTNEVYFSESLAAMLGYSLEEWGSDLAAWAKRVHPDDKPRVERELEAHFRGETELYSCEHRMLCKDGTYRWIIDRGRVIEWTTDHKPQRMIGLHRDITQELEQRLELSEREESYATVIAQSPHGIAVVSTETGQIFSVNPAFCKILGRSEAELMSITWQTFTHPDDIAPNEVLNQQILRGESSEYVMQKRYFRPDGSMIWARLAVKKLQHYRKEQKVHLALVEDITEQVEREERLRTLFNEAPLGIAVIDSLTAELLAINAKYCEIVGRGEPDLLRMTWKDVTHPEDIAADQNLMDEVNAGKRTGFYLRKRLLRPGGGIVWVGMTIAKLTHYHEDRRVHVCMIEDITDRVQNEERMRLDAAVISHTRDGVVVTDLTPRIISVNQAYSDITGYSAEEVIGRNPALLKSGRQDARFYRAMWDEIAATGRWQGELYNRRKNGEVYPQLSTIDTIYDAEGKPQYYVGVFSDIAKLKKSEESFERLAHYDILTGLPNRLMVTSRLTHAIDSAARHDRLIGVLFMDLDHFKNINDSLGHIAGDELLTAVARRLKARIRSEDTIARLGGDEFLILLEDLENPEQAALVARDLLANLSAPFKLASGHEVYSGGSIGISLYPQDGDNAPDLIRNADAAMYLSKSEGRSTFRFYRNSLTEAARKRLELEAALRRALEHNELYVAYQPIVDMKTGIVCGAEALCRWRTADGREISPADFIPVAEETGLIVGVGDFVLRSALAQVSEWQKYPQFRTIAINFSVRQFQKPDWYERFTEIIRQSGVAPRQIEIEITESDIMQRSEEGIEVIRRLHSSGVNIAIDDFGTGYSSLSYLQRFSVNKIKIDQSFVRELPQNHATMQLVRTMITLARNLGLSSLAEGVETAEQMQFLRAEGCDFYQGYLKGRPIAPNEFSRQFLS